ncbi:MAG: hypothetical protein RSA70_05795, partial [Clostridia bacterium]
MAGIIYSEGSGLNNSIFGKSQFPIRSVISQNTEAFEALSLISKIFVMDGSENFAEKYTSETSLGNFEDTGENGAYPKTSMQEGYSKTIIPMTWKSSFEVTQEMVEDAKNGKLKSKANIFATSYNRTREQFAASILAGGIGDTIKFGSKDYDTTCADGKSLFNTTHTSITKGCADQSNKFMKTSIMTATETIIDTLQERMQDTKNDDGHLLN